MTVALGITTFNRPDYLEKCAKAIARTCAPVTDYIYCFNDGSDPKHAGAYKRAYKPLIELGATIIDAPTNGGVAVAKNALIYSALKETDCDHVILCEDDIKVLAPEAVTQYIAIAERHGLHHLSYAHHGPANADGPVDTDGDVEFYPHSVGAWCLYSRECLEAVGAFDENMVNAFEHVEWEMRAYQMGYANNGGPHRFADALGSWIWLTELPNSIERSSIRPRSDWSSNIHNSLRYWHDAKPETYDMLFGPSMPLHAYAQSIIGAQ
jgi:GT2 family glycosyltransferase